MRIKKYGVPFILVLTIILSFSSIHVASNILLPNELNIIAGKINSFAFNIPLKAAFSAEAADVVNINNTQVKDNINIDLAKPCNIETAEVGKYDVQLSLLGIIPIKKVTVTALPETFLIPSGLSVGVNLSTDGIMVLGTGFVKTLDGNNIEPAKNILKSGDIILKVGGNKIETKAQLIDYVEQSNGNPLELTINRNNEIINNKIIAIKDSNDNKYKIGVWVRNSTGGIGTMTYYNPDTKTFGALGHGIMDVDTKQLMTIKEGSIMESSVNSVHKGAKGTPGELLGDIYKEKKFGSINVNTPYGIYGYIEKTDVKNLPDKKMPIGLKQDVREGDAYIKCNVDGNGIKDYNIAIESINKYSSNETKGMVIRITDKDLIDITGGIVQGMSGSPIIQDGKIVGAVTHVFVQDPTKGYGIFIENMLKHEKKLS